VFAELRKDLIVERHLVDRTPIGWIEGENDGLARQVREREVLIGGDA
jgi:hypothetical protein